MSTELETAPRPRAEHLTEIPPASRIGTAILYQGRRPHATLADPWWVLRQEQVIPRPVDTVFKFFCDAQNLERLTPDLLGFQILTPSPIQMAVGTRIAYRIKLWGIPMRWLTGIEDWEPPHRFVDLQLRGPYQHWRHLHRFEPTENGGTLMIDEVELQVRGGPLGALAYGLIVKRSLREIFSYRARTLEELLMSGEFDRLAQ